MSHSTGERNILRKATVQFEDLLIKSLKTDGTCKV